MGLSEIVRADRRGVMSKRAVLACLLAVAVIAGLVLTALLGPAFLGTEHTVMSEAWVRSTVVGRRRRHSDASASGAGRALL